LAADEIATAAKLALAHVLRVLSREIAPARGFVE
jgi:hypothetical protein